MIKQDNITNKKVEMINLKDAYKDFAYDYDEFGSVEDYLGTERDFFKQLFDEDIVTALTSMKNRLNDTGVLVLTQGTTHFTLHMPSIEVVINKIDFSRIFVKEHDNEFQTVHVLDLYHSKEKTESHQYDIVYKIILDDDYRRLLLKAGFKDIKIYGDYNKTKYDQNSKRLIVVAR